MLRAASGSVVVPRLFADDSLRGVGRCSGTLRLAGAQRRPRSAARDNGGPVGDHRPGDDGVDEFARSDQVTGEPVIYCEGVPDKSDVVAKAYDSFYAAWGRSPTLRRIWRDHVTGPDYPEEFAHISFLPLAHLRALADCLNLAADQLLVDLACGAGGPGLWVAKESGARLIGRDLSPVAAERATERAAALGMEDRAEFGQGSFEHTGIADQAADAVMTVDALQYAPDKMKAATRGGTNPSPRRAVRVGGIRAGRRPRRRASCLG